MNLPFKPLSSSLFIAGFLLALPAHAVFKCVDEKGVTHYGDIMPPQCEKKEVKEISSSGQMIRKYDAPLTPEQLKSQEGERAQKAEQQRRIDAQKQKDLALLGTFGSEREFEGQRDRELLQLDARIKTLQLRIGEVDGQLEKLKAEMKFYEVDVAKDGSAKGKKREKNKEIPPRLPLAMDRANSDRAGLTDEIARVEANKLALNARYDAEKVRWKQLKSGMQPGTLSETSPAPAAASKAALAAKPAPVR